jgi:hypothetical protein
MSFLLVWLIRTGGTVEHRPPAEHLRDAAPCPAAGRSATTAATGTEFPAVRLAVLAALIIADPGRIDRQKTWLRVVTGAVIAFITVINLLAVIHL